MGWLGDQAHARWLEQESDRLLSFARAAALPDGGFGWLDDDGRPDPAHPRELWINGRMTHCFAIGHLLGRPLYGSLADHGVDALLELFADREHGGFYPEIGTDGSPDRRKTAYSLAFAVLAGSSATAAARPRGPELLERALAVVESQFWDERAGMVVEEWDEAFTRLDGYRGVNANMHAVECFLAASDASGDAVWRERAGRICERVLGWASGNDWLIPEHFDADWQPIPEFNVTAKADPFRPYGATIGHSLEWARLFVHLAAARGAGPTDPLVSGARALFDRAVDAGWAVDGAPGFVYTVDWDGAPVVTERMHWVVCEAIAAAAALFSATGDAGYEEKYVAWWEYAARYFVDSERGSWRHELDADNAPSASVWAGKPDIYHALQATLIPRLPLTPVLASALARGDLR